MSDCQMFEGYFVMKVDCVFFDLFLAIPIFKCHFSPLLPVYIKAFN